MIQRIQSVYLLLTTIISILFLKGKILSFNTGEGTSLQMRMGGLFRNGSEAGFELIEKTLPVTVLSLLIPLLTLITLFLYKNRRVQMRFILVLIFAALLLVSFALYYTLTLSQDYSASVVPGFRSFIPAISALLLILSYRAVKKDEELVRSYDRIR